MLTSLAGAQKFEGKPLTRSFSVNDFDHRIECRALIQKYDLKLESNIEYYWIKNNKLQKNKGAFSGSLLHGDWQKFNEEGQLIEKGNFITGMKNGLWQYWNLDGELVKSLNYAKGSLDGEAIHYHTDGTVEKIPYDKGLIHGKKIITSADTIYVEKYRHGILIPKKVKSKSGLKFNQLIFWKNKKNKSNEDSDKKNIQEEA